MIWKFCAKPPLPKLARQIVSLYEIIYENETFLKNVKDMIRKQLTEKKYTYNLGFSKISALNYPMCTKKELI